MEFVIGGIMGFLVGAAVLFFVQKNKIDRKEKQLQQMQKKLEQSEQDFETRLQKTVMSLQAEGERQAHDLVEKNKQENQLIIKELEQANIDKIEELERANLIHIKELEDSHQVTIQELTDSHKATIQELTNSHRVELEQKINALKAEYESKLEQLERTKETLPFTNKAEEFDDLLEGLPSLDSLDFDEEGLNEMLTVSDKENLSLSDNTEAGITELLKITSEESSLPQTSETTDEIQQIADFFEDLPSFDEEPRELADGASKIENQDSVLDDLDIEQKPLEEEIKRLSDLLDAFPAISEQEQNTENQNKNKNNQ